MRKYLIIDEDFGVENWEQDSISLIQQFQK